HAARGGVDDPMAQTGLVAGTAGDQVTALLDKEIRPLFQPVFVDAVAIGRDQLVDAEPDGEIVHPLRRRSGRGTSSKSRGSRFRWRGKAAARRRARPS